MNSNQEFNSQLKAHFNRLSDALFASLRDGEQAIFQLSAENSLYVRFNNNRVRQNTAVEQRVVELQFHFNQRSVERSWCLRNDEAFDREQILRELESARTIAAQLPIDAHQVKIKNNGTSERDFHGQIPEPKVLLNDITQIAEGCDLSGLLCTGSVVRANRNSSGQSHWFATESFFLDYSIFNGKTASKGTYADLNWSTEKFKTNLAQAKNMLSLLQRPIKEVKPGQYRTYLAPAAVASLVEMLGWGGLSTSSYKMGRNPLRKIVDGERNLSPLFSCRENFDLGLVPQFNSSGELAPAQIELIQAGRYKEFLTSSRSEKEYGVKANFASDWESPRSLEILPGRLKHEHVLKELGTGFYLSNLHYLNWSDLVSARVTGMTRYACFWVEGGEIIGPIKDLRFDISLYDALGANLQSVTDFQEIEPATDTYNQRQLGGSRVPGFLIDGYTFTL